MKEFFRIGFMGATTDEAVELATEYINFSNIIVPFTGSGKDIAWLAMKDRRFWSWDTQYLSHAIVEGVFNAKEGVQHLITEPVFEQGYATSHLPWHVDINSALLIDGIAQHGSLYELAVLAKCIIQSTAVGRLTHFQVGPIKFWEKFLRQRDKMNQWVGLEGEFNHHWGSFFETDVKGLWPEESILYVDPPKVFQNRDVYSGMRGWQGLNKVLCQDPNVELPRWNKENVFNRLKEVLAVPHTRLIMHYTSDCYPDNYVLEDYLHEMYRTEKCNKVIGHGERADYVYVMDK